MKRFFGAWWWLLEFLVACGSEVNSCAKSPVNIYMPRPKRGANAIRDLVQFYD